VEHTIFEYSNFPRIGMIPETKLAFRLLHAASTNKMLAR
jgi:hypothetical protein